MSGAPCDAPAPGLYLYGIGARPGPDLTAAIDAVTGITGTPPFVLELGERAVIASHHPGGEILQTRRRMLAHTRVLEAAMSAVPVLPMRFGLVGGTEAEVAGLVAAHEHEIEAQLARIAGRVEIGLRVSFPREAALSALLSDHGELIAERDRLQRRGADAHFERIELGRRVAEVLDRRRTDAQAALAARVAPLCERHVLRPPEEDVEVLRAECLVAREDEPGFAEAIAREAAQSAFAPGAEPLIRLVGPVPPFHFVDLSLVRPGAEAA